MSQSTPIMINCRDRVRDLRKLVEWLELAGHEDIVLLDNASTWEPLVEYLKASPHDVHLMPENYGSNALWEHFGWGIGKWGEYVYTDPDVLPIEDCPMNLIQVLHELLERFPQYTKVGPGIYLDDLTPDDTAQYAWERTLVSPPRYLEPGLWDSKIDTTFALYRAGTVKHELEAIRVGHPYQIRHMPWYGNLDEEDAYYLQHAKRGLGGATWTGRLPDVGCT